MLSSCCILYGKIISKARHIRTSDCFPSDCSRYFQKGTYNRPQCEQFKVMWLTCSVEAPDLLSNTVFTEDTFQRSYWQTFRWEMQVSSGSITLWRSGGWRQLRASEFWKHRNTMVTIIDLELRQGHIKFQDGSYCCSNMWHATESALHQK